MMHKHINVHNSYNASLAVAVNVDFTFTS